MSISTEQYELPVYWASALINGDESGLEEDDLKALRDFERYMITVHGKCWCLDVEEDSWFSSHHDATRYGILACDVALYTFDTTRE